MRRFKCFAGLFFREDATPVEIENHGSKMCLLLRSNIVLKFSFRGIYLKIEGLPQSSPGFLGIEWLPLALALLLSLFQNDPVGSPIYFAWISLAQFSVVRFIIGNEEVNFSFAVAFAPSANIVPDTGLRWVIRPKTFDHMEFGDSVEVVNVDSVEILDFTSMGPDNSYSLGHDISFFLCRFVKPLCQRHLARAALERQRPPRTCGDSPRTTARLPGGSIEAAGGHAMKGGVQEVRRTSGTVRAARTIPGVKAYWLRHPAVVPFTHCAAYRVRLSMRPWDHRLSSTVNRRSYPDRSRACTSRGPTAW